MLIVEQILTLCVNKYYFVMKEQMIYVYLVSLNVIMTWQFVLQLQNLNDFEWVLHLLETLIIRVVNPICIVWCPDMQHHMDTQPKRYYMYI